MINGVFIEEEVDNLNLKSNALVSGIVAIVFTIVFLLIGIVVRNWGVSVLGGGLVCLGTALAHMTIDLNKENAKIREYIIKIDDNVKVSEFCEKYKVLEEMGHGLYRVICRKDIETLEANG